jgi:hypothetical protein
MHICIYRSAKPEIWPHYYYRIINKYKWLDGSGVASTYNEPISKAGPSTNFITVPIDGSTLYDVQHPNIYPVIPRRSPDIQNNNVSPIIKPTYFDIQHDCVHPVDLSGSSETQRNNIISNEDDGTSFSTESIS